MSSPVVSIVLPTFNRSDLLRLSIESVRNQTFTNWELIVIDNQSTDKTESIIRELAAKDPRIKYHYVKKSKAPGITEYLNYGIENSKGKYIARIDDDDIWCFNDKLKLQVEFLDLNSDYVLVGGGVIMVDENNKEINRYCKKETNTRIRKYALLSCPFDHPTIMFRKDTADLIGGYRNYKLAEDWELFLRIGKQGKFHNIQEYFAYYLQAGQGISLKDQSETALTQLRILKMYRNDYPNYYLGRILTSLQFLYTLLPDILTRRFQYSVRYIKRRYL